MYRPIYKLMLEEQGVADAVSMETGDACDGCDGCCL